MEDLILIIDNICRYGLYSTINLTNKEQDLEKNLVGLYLKYFEINDESDSKDYPAYQKPKSVLLRKNISSNFPTFSWYHHVVEADQIDKEAHLVMGDAVDDLADIILDLLEVKWRREHNSLEDAIWFFKFIFQAHTQQHLIDLLSFLKTKEVEG